MSIYTPIKVGNHLVPGLWQYMLPYELQSLRIPEERRATCASCPRIKTDDYRKDYRCCTYHPRVPNFLLGFAARAKPLRDKLKSLSQEGWLLPEGFQASPVQWADFLEDVSREQFGKSKNVLCPFLKSETGSCSLYSFRNSVCSTFFCLHDHGQQGEKFWNALQETVMQVELALGQWALARIGFSVTNYIDRLNSLQSKIRSVSTQAHRWSKSALKTIWGRDFGNEVEIFMQCAKVVESEREHLWEIACDTDILEAVEFERATHTVVPKEFQDEIEDDYDNDDDRETASPSDLWRQVLKHHQKMWLVPDRKLALSQRVNLIPRDGRTVSLVYLTKAKGKAIDWQQVVPKREAEALYQFNQPRTMNSQRGQVISNLIKRDAAQFISEWVGRKVLVTSP